MPLHWLLPLFVLNMTVEGKTVNLPVKVGVNEQIEITNHAINALSLCQTYSSKTCKML